MKAVKHKDGIDLALLKLIMQHACKTISIPTWLVNSSAKTGALLDK